MANKFKATYHHKTSESRRPKDFSLRGQTRSEVMADAKRQCPKNYQLALIWHKSNYDTVWFNGSWTDVADKYLSR